MATQFRIRTLTLILVTLLVTACGVVGGGNPPKDNAAASMMPNLPDYTVSNTLDIQEAIAGVAGATSLAAAQPQFTAMITAANALAKCYQAAGAVEGRVYVNKAEPITKSGVIFIINKNVLTNPLTFLSCMPGGGGGSTIQSDLQPCAKAYEVNTGTNTFYIGYVATDTSVCEAFCNQLTACNS